MQTPKRKSEERAWKKPGPVLVTQSGLDSIKAEIADLESQLPDMIADVEHTKSHGDFSENAAYQHAKYVLRSTQGRIRRLNDKIKRAVLIEKKAGDTIQLGSTVVVETSGKEFTFEILGVQEANPAEGRISNISPLGKVLIGKKAGEIALLKMPGRDVEYLIKSVN